MLSYAALADCSASRRSTALVSLAENDTCEFRRIPEELNRWRSIFRNRMRRSVHPVTGVTIGTAMAGVRKANRRDVTVVLLEPGAAVAGVFTANRFCAAPVQICREHLAAGSEVRAILVNTGNANAGTGDDGLARARSTCAALAARLGCAPEQVLPFSTGVIMETLPNDRIEAGLPAAIADARADGWSTAAEAIMTTDTVPKAASTTLQIGGRGWPSPASARAPG